jgi:hypothetical protein
MNTTQMSFTARTRRDADAITAIERALTGYLAPWNLTDIEIHNAAVTAYRATRNSAR